MTSELLRSYYQALRVPNAVVTSKMCLWMSMSSSFCEHLTNGKTSLLSSWWGHCSEEILNGNNFKMKIKMCSVLIVIVLNGLENKRTFQAAAFQDLALQLRRKILKCLSTQRTAVYFWLKRGADFFLKIRKQHGVEGDWEYALEERKGQENGNAHRRGKFSSFPDFITPAAAIES